jgi:U3 small nucleolar RNA-associated protein 14
LLVAPSTLACCSRSQLLCPAVLHSFDGGFSGSDDDEDAEAKAERLGRKLAGGEEQQRQQRQEQQQPGTLQSLDGISLDFDAALDTGDRRVAKSSGVPDHAPGRPGAGAAMAAARRQQQEQLFDGAAAARPSSKQQQVVGEQVRMAGQASSGPASSSQPPPFIKSASFQGARPGYAFTRGKMGVGYYLELSQQQAAAKAAPAAAAAAAEADPAAAAAAAKAAAARQAAIIKLTGSGSNKLSRNQRKKVAKLLKQQQAAADGKALPGSAADDSSDDELEPRQQLANGTAAAANGAASDDEHAPGMQPASKANGTSQRDLIARAFAGDDVEAEFAAEKSAAVEEELPAVDAPVQLPGWGGWSGQQREPKWMQDARSKAEAQRAAAAAGRQDAKLSHVVLSEKWDKKAAKYLAAQLPFPYNNNEVSCWCCCVMLLCGVCTSGCMSVVACHLAGIWGMHLP